MIQNNWTLLVKLRNYRWGDIVRFHYMAFYIDIKLDKKKKHVFDFDDKKLKVWVSAYPNPGNPRMRFGIEPENIYIHVRDPGRYYWVEVELLHPVEYSQPKNFYAKLVESEEMKECHH